MPTMRALLLRQFDDGMHARVGAEPVVLLRQGGELAERVLELAHHSGIRTERRRLTVRREAMELIG